MKKSDYFNCLGLLAIAAIGFSSISGFWGGAIFGSAINSLFLMSVGKIVSRKAAARIEKIARDKILNNENY